MLLVAPPKSGKLQFLLDILPGKNIFSKTGIAASTAGAFTYLYQTGWYIPSEDTFALAGFALFARVFYMKFGQPISDYLGNEVMQIRDALLKQKSSIEIEAEKDLTILESFRDHADVTAALYDMKSENVKLEAEVARMLETVQFLQGIKTKLNEMVSKEKQRQEAARKAQNEAIMNELYQLLSKPEVQDRILQQCLSDLERLPINRI